MIAVSCLPFRDEPIARSCRRTQPRRPDQRRLAMTDREVGAISDFLRHFGSFGCRQICVRRTEPKPRTPEDVGRFVLEILAAWRAEGLCRAVVQSRHDRNSLRGLQAARAHLYARVLPAVGRGRTRMPARAWPPADRRTAPTGPAPRGPDWAPAGAGCAASRRPG